MQLRSAKILSGAVLIAAATAVGTAQADNLDLLVATVDPGTSVSPLVAGRMLCSDPATVSGTGRLTIAGASMGNVTVVAGACDNEWNPIGFRVPTSVRDKLKKHAKDRHAVVLVAKLTATTPDGATQTVNLSRKLSGH